MATKVTLYFQGRTIRNNTLVGRVGGFSESYYTTRATDDTALPAEVNALFNDRVELLGLGVAIVGYKYTAFDIDVHKVIPKAAVAHDWNQGPTHDHEINSMEDALRLKAHSSDNLSRRDIVLAGIPDENAHQGEYRDVSGYTAKLRKFMLTLGNFSMLCKDKLQPLAELGGFFDAAPNKIITPVAHGFATGNKVTMLRCKDKWGRPKTGTYYVTVEDAVTFTLRNGPFTVDAPPAPGGKFQKVVLGLKQIIVDDQSALVPELTTRDVGAPFVAFHGRS